MKLLAPILFTVVCLLPLSAEQPNIILILIDDVGTGWIPPYADRLGVGDIEPEIIDTYEGKRGAISVEAHLEAARNCMPELALLASEGVIFDRAFATASLCAPSRLGLMTGSFQQGWGSYRNVDVHRNGIPADRVTMAEPLKAAGYRTGVVGKWHIAEKDPNAQVSVQGTSSKPGQHPLDRGFDYYFGYNAPGDKDYGSTTLWEGRDLVPERPPGEFLTDLFNSKANQFVDQALQENKPFFLYYAPKTLHGSIAAPPANYQDAFNTGTSFTNRYAGHMLALDKGIEMLIATLTTHEELDNTLIIFTSDNGCTLYGVPPYNAPNRGGKGTGWMGGTNVPFIVWWPGQINPIISDEIISLADVMPTVLDAAGVDIPEGIDGLSLMPFLKGETAQGPRQSISSSGVHSSRWSYSYEAMGENNKQDANDAPIYGWFLKGDDLLMLTTAITPGLYESLPEGYPEQTLLYDISSDRDQRQDLAALAPEKVFGLKMGLHKWLSNMEEPTVSQQEDYHLLLERTEGNGDADGDGVLNFFEYLYGSDLYQPDSDGFWIAANPSQSGNEAAFNWGVKEGFVLGSDYLVSISTDLTGWDPLPAEHYSLVENTQNGLTHVELEITHDYGAKVFLRLEQP